MATKQELIDGLEMAIAQAKRTTAYFSADEWDQPRPAGWTPKQIYCHLASVAGMVPQFAPALAGSPEDVDPLATLDITAMNAQTVGAMASMNPDQIMHAFDSNMGELIDFIKTLPDDQLNARRTTLGYTAPISDILANAIVLHSLHHVYEASARIAA